MGIILLQIDGPPAAHYVPIFTIDSNLWYLDHSVHRMAVEHFVNLLVLGHSFTRTFLSHFDDVEIKVYVVVLDVLILPIIVMRTQVVLFVNIEELVLARLRHNKIRKLALLSPI